MKASHHFLINLFLAIIWIILLRQPNMFQFLLGFGIGWIILWAFQSILNTSSYIQRTKGLVKFLFIFSWLFLKANFNVAKIILFVPKNQIHPAFIAYNIQDLSRFESLLLSQFITLTPGTISVNLEKNLLWIHVLDLKDKQQTIQEIDLFLKHPILKFTR